MGTSSLTSRTGAALVFVAMVATGVVSAVATPAAAATSTAPRTTAHGFGLNPVMRPTSVARPRLRLDATALPQAVDLTPWTMPVGDQGALSSCVTWTVDYAMLGWYARRQGHAGAPFAPMYAYSQIEAKYGLSDEGASVDDAYSIASEQGIDTQSDYPQGSYDWRDLPTPAQHAAAAANKTSGFTYLYNSWPQAPGSAAEPAIQSAITSGHPVALSIPVYSRFMQLTSAASVMTAADVAGSMLGYHEVLIVGYDATGVRIQNSWGTGWADHGFATLSWDFVAGYSLDASVMTGFADTPTNEAAVATVEPANGPTYGGTSVTLHGLGLTGVTDVTFGGVPATAVTVIDDRTVVAVTPPNDSGAQVDVKVSTSTGTSAAPGFTYVQPVVSPITPHVAAPVVTRAVRRGAARLDIWGRDFGATARVTLGGRPARIVGTRSAHHLRVAVPAGVGRVRVRVTTAYGRSAPRTCPGVRRAARRG